MAWEPISPELALVDPELGARARAALPAGSHAPRPAGPPAGEASAAPSREHRAYPFWARVTAAMWLVVLGILVGGAAIPHAQDQPRIVPKDEDSRFCQVPGPTQAPTQPPVLPTRPGGI